MNEIPKPALVGPKIDPRHSAETFDDQPVMTNREGEVGALLEPMLEFKASFEPIYGGATTPSCVSTGPTVDMALFDLRDAVDDLLKDTNREGEG